MADGHEVEAEGDAVAAFANLRREVSLLRRAIEGLSSREDIEIPDYAPTLVQMRQALIELAGRLDRLAAQPALSQTPEQMAMRIAHAAEASRREDHRLLAEAGNRLDGITRILTSRLEIARRAEEQQRWLIGAGAAGVAVGLLLWATFAGPIARAMPENWLWPEQRAAQALGLPMREAGHRLLAVASPQTWRDVASAERLISDNREELAACRKAAAKAKGPVRCRIRVRTE